MNIWILWSIVSIFYAYQYMLRVMPNVMLFDIVNQFHVDASDFGQFSGFYYLGYSLAHIPLGILLDKFGPKKVIPICIIIMSIGLTPILFATNWIYPIFGRFFVGVGSSAAILGVFKIIKMTFHEKVFSRMLSLSVTIGLLGAIYGSGPISVFCSNFGYKNVIKGFVVIGLILGALIFFLMPKNKDKDNNSSSISNIKEVILNHKVIIVCVSSGLMLGTLEGFADAWGTAFLQNVYMLDKSTASYLPSCIYLGMCTCASFVSLVAERKGYLETIIVSGIVICLLFIAILFFRLETGMLSIIFFIMGVCCAYQILAIYQASTYVSERISGLTAAFTNMTVMLFGYAIHSLIGFLVTAFGGVSNINAMIIGVGVIPILTLFGIVGFSYLKIQNNK